MLKKMLFVLLLLFVVSCSTPQERLLIVEDVNLGDVIWQEYPKAEDTYDIFITLSDKGKLYVVKVGNSGEIYKVVFVKEIKCE
jgi:hypothetical protein